MFDFEKLEVYQVARNLNRDVLKYLLSDSQMDGSVKDRWKHSSMNTVLLLAEGVGKMTDADKRASFTSARSAVYECVSLLHLASDLSMIDGATFKDLYDRYEQLSKMLLGMYRSKT
jgi:four helix bundle protein